MFLKRIASGARTTSMVIGKDDEVRPLNSVQLNLLTTDLSSIRLSPCPTSAISNMITLLDVSIYSRCVIPEDGDMQNPDTVEVDQEMEEGSFLLVCLEEHPVPIDLVELHESLSWSDIH